MSSESSSMHGNDPNHTFTRCNADWSPESFEAGGAVSIAFLRGAHGIEGVLDLYEAER